MIMLKGTIFVNNKPYLGEDPDKTHKGSSMGGTGWLSNNAGELPVLIFGKKDDASIEIKGMINLRGHVDRILTRMNKGLIKPKNIKIKIR